MPKKRKHHLDLPKGMTLKHGAYYWRVGNRWIPLGKNRRDAFVKYAEMTLPERKIQYLRDLIQLYLHEVTLNKAPLSQRNDNYSAKTLTFAFYDFLITDIEPKDIYAYMDDRAVKSKHWANKDRSFLSQCFRLAIRKGLVSYNPCKDVSTFTIFPNNRLIQDWEFEAVYNIASPLIQNTMQMAYLTAARRQSILNIKWSDVKDDHILMYDFKVKRPQQPKPFKMILSDKLNVLFGKIRQERGNILSLYVFSTRRGQPYTMDGFSSIWQRTIKKALENGVIKEKFSFHNIRAMALTKIDEERGFAEATSTAGHANPSVTKKVYLRGIKERKPTE